MVKKREMKGQPGKKVGNGWAMDVGREFFLHFPLQLSFQLTAVNIVCPTSKDIMFGFMVYRRMSI